MEPYEWMKFYEAAVLETDCLSLPSRIEAAQNAIGQRVTLKIPKQGDCSHAQRTISIQARRVSKSRMPSV
jgi:hypothetical protein